MAQRDHPSDLTLLGLIPRTGRFNLLWSVSIAVFLSAIEWADGNARAHYGLVVNLTYALCLGYWCWTIIGIVWLREARRRWQTLPDAVQRFERRGVYGLIGWPSFALAGLVGVPIACVFGMFLAESLLGLPWPVSTSDLHPPFAVALVLCYSIALLTFTIDYLRVRLAAHEVRSEATQRQALETQLQLLRAQLEPHMLFNTLANLHALIEADPVQAQDMLARVIAFFRGTLTASRAGVHPLSEEFALASDYLALMKVRMGPRLAVTLDLPSELSALPVPSLLIQPLVENAIKHGLEPTREGGHITVSARQNGAYLDLTVADTGRGQQAAEAGRRGPPGFGLTCVRDRIRSAYRGEASLQLSPAPEASGTIATLRLPLSVVPDESAVTSMPMPLSPL